jgi:hypothetical protein
MNMPHEENSEAGSAVASHYRGASEARIDEHREGHATLLRSLLVFRVWF